MKIKSLAIIAIAFLAFSCKQESSNTDKKDATPAYADDFFRVSFDVIVKEDDNFQLYYTLDGSINFNEESSVWMPVKGSPNVQEVVFTLPDELIPSLIRIDFGHGKNENPSDVELKSFKMTYQDKKMAANELEIFNYFTPFEPFTVVEPNTTILKRGSKTQDVGPVLYPKELITDKINEITGGLSPE